MIPKTSLRLVTSSPVIESATFDISTDNVAHIMSILRDHLYSDKVLAVLREYGSNAWDAHREAKKGHTPIEVTLPTMMAPTLVIRDRGLGMSPDEVFTVYTQYGVSTKRNSDGTVGMFGIGSKSGFAYSDSFTITSYNGGMQRTYVALLDVSEKGRIDLLCEAPSTETGIEIRIAVKPKDIAEFTAKAQELYKYFSPQPTINTELPKLPASQKVLQHGCLYTDRPAYSQGWVAIMGCVAYRIDLTQLKNTSGEGIAGFLDYGAGALYFDIGALQVSASREELKYSDVTKYALVVKFNALCEEYVEYVLSSVRNNNLSFWEQRLGLQALKVFNLSVPTGYADLLAPNVAIRDVTLESFDLRTIPRRQNSQRRLTSRMVIALEVNTATRLILCDTLRAAAGYTDLTAYDYAIYRKSSNIPWEKVEEDVRLFCEKVYITGIPIHRLSALPWQKPMRGKLRGNDPKYRSKVFRYIPEYAHHSPKSQMWLEETRTLTDDDVFVILSAFEVSEYHFPSKYNEDKRLVETFGGTLPPIYGYKTSRTKPLVESDCTGIPYLVWRKRFAQSLLTPLVRKQLEQWQWYSFASEAYLRQLKSNNGVLVETTLGTAHPITQFMQTLVTNAKDTDCTTSIALRILQEVAEETNVVIMAATAIYQKYPLLALQHYSVGEVWGPNAVHWLQYITLIDGDVK